VASLEVGVAVACEDLVEQLQVVGHRPSQPHVRRGREDQLAPFRLFFREIGEDVFPVGQRGHVDAGPLRHQRLRPRPPLQERARERQDDERVARDGGDR
jgi:hypothetical protein